jgi:hypothetical protein
MQKRDIPKVRYVPAAREKQAPSHIACRKAAYIAQSISHCAAIYRAEGISQKKANAPGLPTVRLL